MWATKLESAIHKRGPRNRKKNGLEGMEADKAAAVVWLHNQEDDRGDNGDVSQHARYVVSRARLPRPEPIEPAELQSGCMLDKPWNHLVSERHTRCKMP